ncbi:hypothetical protein BDN72DRAFT_190010 [Pluteus cervinus]|uniref:Uncharacterized protein n=1 Tax=Pluteus cervinus TaxID=181527 RepID=A0ACD3AIS5_9AGAR|nr:hypothetical protein BDN72DRAFT_190010 [Pluteus cervinus]
MQCEGKKEVLGWSGLDYRCCCCCWNATKPSNVCAKTSSEGNIALNCSAVRIGSGLGEMPVDVEDVASAIARSNFMRKGSGGAGISCE